MKKIFAVLVFLLSACTTAPETTPMVTVQHGRIPVTCMTGEGHTLNVPPTDLKAVTALEDQGWERCDADETPTALIRSMREPSTYTLIPHPNCTLELYGEIGIANVDWHQSLLEVLADPTVYCSD